MLMLLLWFDIPGFILKPAEAEVEFEVVFELLFSLIKFEIPI